jgi:hypothetical protein
MPPRVSTKSEVESKRRATRIGGIAMLNKLKHLGIEDCESARDLEVRMP